LLILVGLSLGGEKTGYHGSFEAAAMVASEWMMMVVFLWIMGSMKM
jgi:hypothetical protein